MSDHTLNPFLSVMIRIGRVKLEIFPGTSGIFIYRPVVWSANKKYSVGEWTRIVPPWKQKLRPSKT